MSEQKPTKNILLVGVGGQGVLLVSTIIAQAAIELSFDVKTNEVHGMAQRGGSVLAQVRYGKEVFSPLVWEGTVDLLISLEKAEALRYAHYLKKDALAVVSNQTIIPVTVSSGKAEYPSDLDQRLSKAFPRLVLIDSLAIAQQLGNAKAANIVTLGAAAKELPCLADGWNRAIETCIPEKHRQLNTAAFAAGGAFKNE